MGQSVGGAKMGEPQEKTPDTLASRTWLVSHVARAGLEPTPDPVVTGEMIEWLSAVMKYQRSSPLGHGGRPSNFTDNRGTTGKHDGHLHQQESVLATVVSLVYLSLLHSCQQSLEFQNLLELDT